MRDLNRIEPMLQLLREVWMESPDLRLGQIIVNALRPSDQVPVVFYAEDDKMAEGLRGLTDLGARNPESESDESI